MGFVSRSRRHRGLRSRLRRRRLSRTGLHGLSGRRASRRRLAQRAGDLRRRIVFRADRLPAGGAGRALVAGAVEGRRRLRRFRAAAREHRARCRGGARPRARSRSVRSPAAGCGSDGARLDWQIVRPKTTDLPFWCGDVTPRNLRVPEGAMRTHANGVTGVASLKIAVTDVAKTAARYAALAGAAAVTQANGSARVVIGETAFELDRRRCSAGACRTARRGADVAAAARTRCEGARHEARARRGAVDRSRMRAIGTGQSCGACFGWLLRSLRCPPARPQLRSRRSFSGLSSFRRSSRAIR